MKDQTRLRPLSLSNCLWDAFCIASIIGIWPRFIEPQLIQTKQLHLPIPSLPPSLNGFKILQFSDLHLNEQTKDSFLEKIISTVDALRPDLIVFTGDFLCYSSLPDRKKLQAFLCRFHAPYGCYAILGNHDYAKYVSINAKGDYDLIDDSDTSIVRAFKRLFTKTTLSKTMTERAKGIAYHAELMEVLAATPFKLLHNESITIPIKDAALNLFGCGEYILGHCLPQQAFANHRQNSGPNIILVHNPDAVPHLKDYPADIVLCGHTHGGQVNLPWMWKKFTLLENMRFKKGLIRVHDKWMYVNRGVGSVLPFRWFASPELLLLTLEQKNA